MTRACKNWQVGGGRAPATVTGMQTCRNYAVDSYRDERDRLTGLPERASLLAELDHRLQQCRGPGHELALMAVHVDGLSGTGRTHGRRVADLLVRSAAERLTGCVRTTDRVARRGRHEFTVLVDPLSAPEVAASVATKICNVMARGFAIEGHELPAAATVGIVLCPQDGLDAGMLAERLDATLARARQGGDGYRFDDGRRAFGVEAVADAVRDPREGLERGQFEVLFQPRIALASGEITGAEALLRWTHPTEGQIGPDEFIPVAETTDLIHDIGHHVLETACTRACAWRPDGAVRRRVSVNVSGRELDRADFPERTRRILEATGLEPDRLELEITESALMRRPADAARNLSALREMGVRLALDDFGTGYSSLAYLRNFPLDVLKIDRSFVADIAHNDTGRVLFRSIVGLAHGLELEVVAEGVETRAQLDTLRELGCDEVQGFLFAPAVTAEALEQMLHAGRDPFALPGAGSGGP